MTHLAQITALLAACAAGVGPTAAVSQTILNLDARRLVQGESSAFLQKPLASPGVLSWSPNLGDNLKLAQAVQTPTAPGELRPQVVGGGVIPVPNSPNSPSVVGVNAGPTPDSPGLALYGLPEAPKIALPTAIPLPPTAARVPPPEAALQLAVEIHYRTSTGSNGFCTGVLVGRHQVLTAGHCGCGVPNSYEVHIGQDANDLPLPVQSIAMFDARVCAGYDKSGRDIALLITDSDLNCLNSGWTAKDYKSFCSVSGANYEIFAQFDHREDTKVYNLASRLKPGDVVTAIGYGINNAGTYGRRLMAPIPILSPDCVGGGYPYICAPFAEMLLVDNAARGDDTCEGDSGGPVYLFDDAHQSAQLIAIVSRAAPFTQGANGCGGGGIYELLGRKAVVDWLGAHGVPDLTIMLTQ